MEYDPFRDLAPVSLVGASPNLLVVDPALKVDSVKEFVALAQSQPGKLNYGSVGNGSTSHLTMELFKEAAGNDIVHRPPPGGPPEDTPRLPPSFESSLVDLESTPLNTTH